MSAEEYNLRPLWDAILDVYQAFADVCNRHGLRYYVTGGTLLGAARHKGFIPWDDDFDVVMPRQDYRRFFDVVCEELPDGFRAYDFRTKRESDRWRWMFGKVMCDDANRVSAVSEASNLDLYGGVYIDVIPIDGMPKSTIPFYWWALRRSRWRDLWQRDKLSHQQKVKFEKWLMKWDYDASPAVDDYNTNGRRLKTRALTAKSFGEPIMMDFDKIQVPCPLEWKKFLTLIYGDWRSLPAEEKRVPSHQVRRTGK